MNLNCQQIISFKYRTPANSFNYLFSFWNLCLLNSNCIENDLRSGSCSLIAHYLETRQSASESWRVHLQINHATCYRRTAADAVIAGPFSFSNPKQFPHDDTKLQQAEAIAGTTTTRNNE